MTLREFREAVKAMASGRACSADLEQMIHDGRDGGGESVEYQVWISGHGFASAATPREAVERMRARLECGPVQEDVSELRQGVGAELDLG